MEVGMGLRAMIEKADLYHFAEKPAPDPTPGDSDPFGFAADITAPSATQANPTTPPKSEGTPLDWPLEKVYTVAKVDMGKSGADTPLLLRDSLVARSKTPLTGETLLTMVRGLDGIDDSWNEADSLEDARKRIAALTKFLTFIDRDVVAKAEAASQSYVSTKASNDARIQELDGQIAALQAQREQVISETGGAKAQADGASQAVKAQGEAKKAMVQTHIDRYKDLLVFFGAS